MYSALLKTTYSDISHLSKQLIITIIIIIIIIIIYSPITNFINTISAAICNAIGRVHDALEIAYISEALRLVGVHC